LPRIFLSAGEASGENYGAALMEVLRRRVPGAEFFGLGGTRMEAAGLRRIVRAEDVAVMGITEIVRHIPRILREYRKLKAAIRRERPDVAILIDFPDVNLGLARLLKKLGIPVVFFVSPQVWAWKKHRLPQIRRNVDRMLVIFPFEEGFYREHGVAATFVGHPLAEPAAPTISREEFAREYSIDPAKEWIGLLPGSRPSEIARNLPEMLRAAELLSEQGACQFLLPLAPTLTPAHISAISATVAACKAATTTLTLDARATLHHASASIVASGTATVEAALIGNPFIVVYRVSRLTYAIAKQVVSVPHVAMVNLIAGKRIVPELIQNDFTAVNIVEALGPLLSDGEARQTMQAEFCRVGTLLRKGSSPIEQVAEIALGLIRQKTASS
jgi:lipid-A-disaccharide synthase